jgi:hypothetical protein
MSRMWPWYLLARDFLSINEAGDSSKLIAHSEILKKIDGGEKNHKAK